MSDADQVAFTSEYLDQGLGGSQGDVLAVLIANRSSLILPVIERKIEEVLKSPNPAECFTRKGVDPKAFVGFARAAIAYAGDEQALRATVRLLKLDDKEFDRMVEWALQRNISTNPFTLAYWGFEMGAPAVDTRIARWVEQTLANRIPEYPGGPPSLERQWAAVLVERYAGVPVHEQWQNDPVVSRLKPEFAASRHDAVYGFALEEWEKNPRRIRAMTDAEVIAFTRARAWTVSTLDSSSVFQSTASMPCSLSPAFEARSFCPPSNGGSRS
jgi:hypothetical protein